MRHPSDYYVRYLLAEAWGEDPDATGITIETVNETLKDNGLLPMIEPQWDFLRATFYCPEDFHFNNRAHKGTANFMKREKLHSIWDPNEEMKRVLDELLSDMNRRVQRTVHILIMGDIPSDIIALKVNEKFRVAKSLTGPMIDHYRHYFWRPYNLTEQEWEEFLKGHIHADHYLAPLYCGEQQALFRAGMHPKYDYRGALRDTHRQLSFRIQNMEHKPDDKHHIDLLVKMGREQRVIYEKLYGEGGGFEERAREVRKFLMEYKVPDLKALETLVGEKGSYSGDGKDKEKSKDKKQPKGDDDAGNADA